MSHVRDFALYEAERLALIEALSAMTQLADVRERLASTMLEQRDDYRNETMEAEAKTERLGVMIDELCRENELGTIVLDSSPVQLEKIRARLRSDREGRTF